MAQPPLLTIINDLQIPFPYLLFVTADSRIVGGKNRMFTTLYGIITTLYGIITTLYGIIATLYGIITGLCLSNIC